MSDITLKILSSAFFIGPFIQRHNMGLTRIQMLSEPLDRSDLARSIAALKPQKNFWFVSSTQCCVLRDSTYSAIFSVA